MKKIKTIQVRNFVRRHVPFDTVRKIEGGYAATIYLTSTKPRAMSQVGHYRRLFEEVLGPSVQVEARFPKVPGNALREIADFSIEMRMTDDSVRAVV